LPTNFMKYNERADEYLEELYSFEKAKTWEEKFHVMERLLGGTYYFSHEPTWEQKATSLEIELLENLSLINLVYVS